MKKSILNTNTSSWAGAVSRVALAVIIFAHGPEKFIGLSGGSGFEGSLLWISDTIGWAHVVAFTFLVLETLASISLVLGFATRLWSVLIVISTTAMSASYLKHGFYMNWMGNQSGEGIEFFLILTALALTLSLTGAGKLSLDHVLAGRKVSAETNSSSVSGKTIVAA